MQFNIKKYWYLTLFLLVAVVILIYFSFNNSNTVINNSLISKNLVEKIKKDQIVTVGYIPWYFPFSYSDQQNSPAGFSVEFTKMLVDKMNNNLGLRYLQTKFVPMTINEDYRRTYPALANKEVMFECNTTLDLPQKPIGVIFSKPFFVSSVHILSPKAQPIKTLAEVQDKLLLAHEGFFQQLMLKVMNEELKLNVGIQAVPIIQETGIRLIDGVGVGIVGDAFRLFNVLYALPNPEEFVAGVRPITEVSYVCSMPEGALELQKIINNAITDVLADENYQRMYQRWFITQTRDLNIALSFPMADGMKKIINSAGGKINLDLVNPAK